MEFSDYQYLDARSQTTDFLIQPSSLSVEFPVVTLIEEMKPVVTEKRIEFRDDSKLIAHFQLLGLSDFWTRNRIESFLTESSSTTVKLSILTLMEEIKPIIVT